MKIKQGVRRSLLGLLWVMLLLFLVSCGEAGVQQPTRTPVIATSTPIPVAAPTWVAAAKKQGFQTHGQYIAAKAIALAQSLYGAQENEYYADDPALAPVIAYWKSACQKADGSLCDEVKSGNLQCVEFVAGIFASIDDELPSVADANLLWNLYKGKVGWQEIPANASQTPVLGDIATWTGGSNGHLAVVVDLQAPKDGQDGYITVVQSNAPSLFDKLTWYANGKIDAWPGYQLQGFIRQQEIAPCLQTQVTATQQQWEMLAIQVALHYGTPSKYFLRQVCQSGFQATDQQGHVIRSATGAIGIAQLPLSVAAQVPRCVTNFLANAPNCDQMPGSLPSGKGVDPAKPAEALPAAAYVMSMLYGHYVQNSALKMPQDQVMAYQMALAAYNAGSSVVDKAITTCTKEHWLNCLDLWQPDHHTEKYVDSVLKVLK